MIKTSNFKKINTTSASEQALQQLINAIKSGEYQIGDRLPSERQLADMMGISRNTLREAIQILAFLNVLEMQHGAGTFVRSIEIDGAMAIKAAEILATDDSYFHALETRVLIEPVIASLAAERAEEADIALMERGLEEIKLRTEAMKSWGGAAMRFHLAIARSAKNPILEHAIITPLAIWYNNNPDWLDLISQKLLTEPRLIQAYDKCLDVFEAIRDRDSERASIAMRDRVNHIKEMFYGK